MRVQTESQRACLICGRVFPAKRAHAVCCSVACRMKRMRNKRTPVALLHPNLPSGVDLPARFEKGTWEARAWVRDLRAGLVNPKEPAPTIPDPPVIQRTRKRKPLPAPPTVGKRKLVRATDRPSKSKSRPSGKRETAKRA